MAIVLHPLANLSNTLPPFFVDNLLQAYRHGKSCLKFQILRNQLIRSLPSAPSPGPATFVANCLEVLQHVRPPHDECLSHMLISALHESDPSGWPNEDITIARRLAGFLFCKILIGTLKMDSRVAVKLPVAFHFDLKDIGKILNPGQRDEKLQWRAAEELVECYLFSLLKRRLYSGAFSLIKSFKFETCNFQPLIATLVDKGQVNLAEEFAVYLGKDVVKLLVQHCIDSGMFKLAYKMVNQYKLCSAFPDAYHLYIKSILRNCVEKGLWKAVKEIVAGDTAFIDYLVILATEDNDAKKVEELKKHFHVDTIPDSSDKDGCNPESGYLQLESLMSENNIYWIDTRKGLQFATNALSGVNMVGIDCEWKPDFRSGKENKVSILQVASLEVVLVLDLISLIRKCPSSLNNFIKYLFHSPDIVKLGYAVQHDFRKLSQSIKEIDAFAFCVNVLDFRLVPGLQTKKGLSSLVQATLGVPLSKKVRMSNWEIRPLKKQQLHYAAMDAAVLLRVFYSLPKFSTMTSVVQGCKPYLKNYEFRYNSGAKELSDGKLSHVSINLGKTASHEELVLASCELLGIPEPGRMKSVLFEFAALATKSRPPKFTTISMSHKNTAFCSSVTIAKTTFLGSVASSQKDAEFWAAHAALSIVSTGNHCTGYRFYSEGLSILQACSLDSKCGCLHLWQSCAQKK